MLFLMFVSFAVLFFIMYPGYLLFVLEKFNSFFEDRYIQRKEKYFEQMHSRIDAIKNKIDAISFDEETRDRLKRLCDAYEEELRERVEEDQEVL